MTALLQIDFVSDVACPWCAVGLSALQQALARVADVARVEIRCQPFELNPQMRPEGEDVSDYLSRKYGSTPGQQAAVRDTIRQRGAEAGFDFHPDGRGRIYNTFDAHRLLHWAGEQGAPGQQLALKRALLEAYHGRAENPSSPAVALAACVQVGLDAGEAADILSSERYADAVRERERHFSAAGIHSVPAAIVNGKYLISGGQPAQVFEQALRQIAAEAD
jgi:predicted DsbA family dithiol-disulfide isomerase